MALAKMQNNEELARYLRNLESRANILLKDSIKSASTELNRLLRKKTAHEGAAAGYFAVASVDRMIHLTNASDLMAPNADVTRRKEFFFNKHGRRPKWLQGLVDKHNISKEKLSTKNVFLARFVFAEQLGNTTNLASIGKMLDAVYANYLVPAEEAGLPHVNARDIPLSDLMIEAAAKQKAAASSTAESAKKAGGSDSAAIIEKIAPKDLDASKQTAEEVLDLAQNHLTHQNGPNTILQRLMGNIASIAEKRSLHIEDVVQKWAINHQYLVDDSEVISMAPPFYSSPKDAFIEVFGYPVKVDGDGDKADLWVNTFREMSMDVSLMTPRNLMLATMLFGLERMGMSAERLNATLRIASEIDEQAQCKINKLMRR